MPRRELSDRLRQYLTARVDLLRSWESSDITRVNGLAAKQSEGRFFFLPSAVPSLCAVLADRFPAQARSIVFQAEKICRHKFDLLGYENLEYGEPIDWHLDLVHGKRGPKKPWFKIKYLDFDEVGDSKITWELNRHQHFITLAKAYHLSGEEKFACEILAQWTDWQTNNPYPIGMNWASSLEVAFRSLSWIWTFFLLQECPLFTADLRRDWLRALSLNGRHIETYLSTYFSPNTHLLGEGLALFFLGVLFPGLSRATTWRKQGWKILVQGAPTQVRADGFYFEQSTYYHVYALDMFMHARILAQLNAVVIPAEFDQTLQRMLDALLLLGRAGAPPAIGDDDGGRLFDPQRNRAEHLLDPLATGAAVYKNGAYKFLAGSPREETLWLLGEKGIDEFEALPTIEPSENSAALQGSGFYLMADPESTQQLLIVAGPCGAGGGGHAHADALSIGLTREGRTLLMDRGTFEYVGDTGERDRLRGTGAHNTMRVDGCDQAEAAGPFSWRHCLPANVERWVTGRQFDLFEGSHAGYSRLLSPVTHRRWVFYRKQNFWLVFDRAEGAGEHQLDIAWHLGPTLAVASFNPCRFEDEKNSLAFLTTPDSAWSQSVSRDYWSSGYGRRERANVLRFGGAFALPADFATLISEEKGSDLGCLQRVPTQVSTHEQTAVSAFRYTVGSQDHNFIFALRPGRWSAGPWISDAAFIYWSFDRGRELCNLVLCDASYADVGGHSILSCESRIRYVEVSSSSKNMEMVSSDPEKVRFQYPFDRMWPLIGSAVQPQDPGTVV